MHDSVARGHSKRLWYQALRFHAAREAAAATATHYAVWSRHGSEWRFASVPAAPANYTVLDDVGFIKLAQPDGTL
ncbi:hypothetical protein E4L96_04060, partial [Massilia arenosa]